ncbi:MAG TPA: hypothetical protein DIV86_07155 [Alphaproteobacteria bacterium]|nr:hypothetical protein [Alphaproteobacteria bacterium]
MLTIEDIEVQDIDYLSGQNYLIIDSEAFRKFTLPFKHYIKIETDIRDPYKRFDAESNDLSFFNIFDEVLSDLGMKAVVPKIVACELLGSADRAGKKRGVNNKVDQGILEIIRQNFENIFLAENIMPRERLERIYEINAKHNDKNQATRILKRRMKGSGLGDEEIIEIIAQNQQSNFFVITGDNALGAEVNEYKNASGMTFVGLLISLSDCGYLATKGFAESKKFPGGQTILRKMLVISLANNTDVTTSEVFEELLSQKGFSFCKIRRTETKTYEQIVEEIRTKNSFRR